jgi:hypothetical protein
VAVGHADDGFLEVPVAEAYRPQHGAVRRAGDAGGDQMGTSVELFVGRHRDISLGRQHSLGASIAE